MWFIILLLLLMSSCEKPQTKEALKAEEVRSLFKERGCTDCHDKTRELIGPSFMEIAKRYKGEAKAENILFRSLKEGSCKKWKARWERGRHKKLYRER